MIAFAVIGFLVLALIYFFLRYQNLQRELNQIKFSLRTLDTKSKFSMNALSMLAGQIQHSYLAKLEAKRKHKLINEEEYQHANSILSSVEQIVINCCDHHMTVEEAVKKALENSDYDMEDLKKYIAKQPSDVRMSWSKNTVGGFITACHLLCTERVKTAPSRDEKEPASQQSA